MRIALAQVNPTVGDLSGNARLVIDGIERAREAAADIVCFPELVITGYPPEDLLLKPSFVRDNLAQLEIVAQATKETEASLTQTLQTATQLTGLSRELSRLIQPTASA